MTHATSSTRTVSMKGGGYYSEHTRGAKDVIDQTASLALAAFAEVDLAHGAGPVAIADFGAADGGTSVDLVRAVVGDARARAAHRPITVTYTDLPRNDYSALFTMLQGERPDVHSYLADHDDVFAFAAGTSFYRQIFPASSLDLGFSATAMHWLSGLPVEISNHVHAVGATGPEFEAFRTWAMADWETLLVHRARELKPGGRLVMSNFCIDEAGRYLGGTGGVDMFDTFARLWRALVDDGTITEAEFRRTTFPQFYKTVAQYRAPFDASDGVARAAGLHLVSAETRLVRCPYAQAYAAHGDAAAFAAAYVPTLRSWSETVFHGGLDPARPAAERRAVVDRFYDSYEARVREQPAGHAMDYVHVYMVVAKEG